MTPTPEEAAEMNLIIQTRFGIQFENRAPDPSAYAAANAEAEEWLRAKRANGQTELTQLWWNKE